MSSSKHVALTWMLASIEDPELIKRILAHRQEWGEEAAPVVPLGARAPPQSSLF